MNSYLDRAATAPAAAATQMQLPTPTTGPRRHNTTTSTLLHVAPGAAAAGTYFALVPVARACGLPSSAALSASALLAVAPIQVAILLVHARRNRDQPDNEPVQLRARLPLRSLVGWALLVVALAAVAFTITKPIPRVLQSTRFSSWPHPGEVHLGTPGGLS